MHINFFRREANGAHANGESMTPVAASVHEEAFSGAQEAPAAISEKALVYHAVVRWVVYMATFALPLFFLPWTTSILELNKQFLLVLAAGVGLIAWLLGVVISGQISFRVTMLDKGILAFLGATAVATLFSIAKLKSVFGLGVSLSESLLTILSLTILYFLAVNVFEDRGRSLRSTLLVSLTIALGYGLLQMFTVYLLPFSFANSRAFNTVGSINSLGIIAALALPLFAKARILVRGIAFLDVAKLGMVLSVIILALLNWWVLWIVAFAGMFLMIALDSVGAAIARQAGEGFKMAQFLLPMTVIVLGVFLMIIKFNLASVKGQLPIEIAPSFSFSADVATSVLGESLITGYGPENFSIAFDKYGASKLANSNLSNLKFFDSVSQAFNVLIHGGIISALALLFLLGSIVRLFAKYRNIVASHIVNREEVSGTFAALFAGCVALFVYPFNLSLMFVFYGLLALTGLLLWGHIKRVVNIEDRPTFSLAASLGFITGLIVVLSGTYFLSTKYAADARYASALAATDVTAAVDSLVKSINWDTNDDRYYRSLSQGMLGQLQQEINKKSTDTAKIQNLIDSATAVAKRATEIAPRESNNWFNLGTVYQALIGLREGVDRLAEESYVKASELRPGDPAFYNRIGQMYLAKADLVRQLARSAGANATQFNQEADASLVKAEDAFKKAIEQSNNFGLAIYNLGAVYDRQGKVKEAIKQIEKIIPFNANQANMLFELGLLYYRDERKSDAMAAFQRTVLVSPDYANARWYLALLYEEKKEFPAAIEQLEKILAIEANKDNQTVIDKLNALKAGQTATPPAGVDNQQPLQ